MSGAFTVALTAVSELRSNEIALLALPKTGDELPRSGKTSARAVAERFAEICEEIPKSAEMSRERFAANRDRRITVTGC